MRSAPSMATVSQYQSGKSFDLPSSMLNQHERIVYHSDERPFKCDKCLKAFKSKRNLQNHQRSHSDERPFQCDKCPKKLKSKGALQSHDKRSHSDERPFQCDKCSKAYTVKWDLQSHDRSHSQERPFSKKFKSKRELQSHERFHSDECPFFNATNVPKHSSRKEICRGMRDHILTNALSKRQLMSQEGQVEKWQWTLTMRQRRLVVPFNVIFARKCSLTTAV